MADVFVSYSRRDSEFVSKLAAALEGLGKDVWVDVEGIRDAEVFPAALRTAVEASDGFVFVISPDSVASSYCEQEVEHALELNKRIVPLVLHRVSDERVPEGIRERNWIPADGDGEFDQVVERVVSALDTDLAWAKEHTSWLLKALEWDTKGRDRSFLLRGSELAAAEQWLAGAAGKDPEPTSLHTEYVLASRMAASRRQRAFLGASLVVTAIALALLVFALISRHSAVTAQQTAKSRALAAESINQQRQDPELSILLARQAVQTKATPDALFALRGALDASPLRARLVPAGPQSCTPPIGGPGLAYSPAGTRLAEALCDGTVRVYDARSDRPLGPLKVAGGTGAVAFSPDGSLLAVGSGSGAEVMDAASGALMTRLPLKSAVNGLAFSPDGSRVAATTQDQAMNSSLVVWPVRGGPARTIATGAFNPLFGSTAVRHVLFTRDGRALIVGGAPGVRVYSLATGRLQRTLPGTQVADDIALSGDGRRLAVSVLPFNENQLSITPLPVASTTTVPDTVTLWSVPAWRSEGTLASFTGKEQPAVAFSPDGSSVAIGGADGQAGIWTVRTRQQVVSFPGSKSAVVGMAFTPDGKLVATAGVDGTAAVWRAGGFDLKDLDTGGVINFASASPDRLTIVDLTGLRSWQLPSLRPLPPLRLLSAGAPPGSEGGQLSPDGDLAWWHTAKDIEVWDTRLGRMIGTLPPGMAPAIALARRGVHRAAFIDIGPGSPMEIVDFSSGRKRSLEGPQPKCPGGWRWAVFSPDNRFLASTTLCGQSAVWNASTGKRVSAFADSVPVSLTDFASDDDHLAVGLNDGTVALWDVRKPRLVHVLAGHTSAIGVVAYSPGGKMVLSTSFDGTSRVWDAATGRVLRIFPVSGGAVFTADGKQVVIFDGQGIIHFYDACALCGNAHGLLALAHARVTRPLTPVERATFVNGS